MSRKIIGLITAFPESISAQRIFDGIFSQCNKYGYDVAVFSTLEMTCNQQKNFLEGELRIYDLINYDRLDAVIVDTASLRNGNVTEVADMILQDLEKNCTKPVFSVGEKLGDYPLYCVSDRAIFREVTSHVLDIHQCNKIYFLTGAKENRVSYDRLAGFTDEMKERGIPVDDNQIFWGDFWYTGGKEMADKITSGEVEMPEAVICASDHMAIGLVNHLVQNGIRVPEDIIVTGFDATQEAAINDIAVTSFEPDFSETMVEVVNQIRRSIEPGKEIYPYQYAEQSHLRVGGSCGCPYEHEYIAKKFRNSLYYPNHDYTTQRDSYDIGTLLESNMLEYLCDNRSIEDFKFEIVKVIYLLKPYSEFYLCLDQNWLNPDYCCVNGYPENIDVEIYLNHAENSGYYPNKTFATKEILPELGSDDHEPSVYYFMPVHFIEKSMGYAVLRRPLSSKHYPNFLLRKWVKNINCALEINRTQHRLLSLSTKDGMTGVYNRRGMELKLDHMLANAAPTDSMLAFVIDMDSLKLLNDTFGHVDGDYGIKAVCSAAMSITKENELCVRAGGDEFYVIGVGNYSVSDASQRILDFEAAIQKINNQNDKPYTLSASIGSACIPLSSGMNAMGIIKIADAKMYENKVQKKTLV